METILSYLILALVAATLIVGLYLAAKVKTIHYLLQQPVVKKMSPQLRLKPVKLDEAMDRNRRGGQEGRGDRSDRNEGGRDGNRERGDREGRGRGRGRGRDRDGQEGRGDRPERAERNEGGRGDRPERAERNDGERGDREGRGRGRGRDRDRNRDGRERPQRELIDNSEAREAREPREPREARSEAREAAPAPQATAAAPAAQEQAPLSPRRPLPNLSANDEAREVTTSSNDGSENFVGSGNDNDVQHGRRLQLKKKPRFELDEEDVKA